MNGFLMPLEKLLAHFEGWKSFKKNISFGILNLLDCSWAFLVNGLLTFHPTGIGWPSSEYFLYCTYSVPSHGARKPEKVLP